MTEPYLSTDNPYSHPDIAQAASAAMESGKPMCRCPLHHGVDQALADQEDGLCQSCRKNCPQDQARAIARQLGR